MENKWIKIKNERRRRERRKLPRSDCVFFFLFFFFCRKKICGTLPMPRFGAVCPRNTGIQLRARYSQVRVKYTGRRSYARICRFVENIENQPESIVASCSSSKSTAWLNTSSRFPARQRRRSPRRSAPPRTCPLISGTSGQSSTSN